MLTPQVVEIEGWDRPRLERAFRDSEKRLKDIVENAPVPIVIYDADFRYVLANRHVRDTFWEGRDLVGRTAYDAWPEETAARLTARVREVLVAQAPVESEDTLPRPDGDHTMLIQRFPLLDIDGAIYGVAVIGMDITAQKRAEAATRDASAHVERVNRAKSELLSRMGHRLRTPLNAILGYGQLLQGEELTPAAADSVECIMKAGGRLLALLDEVHEISLLEAGTKPLVVGPLHASDALREALEDVRALAQERNVALVPDLRDGMYQFVLADPPGLRKALVNLLTNAVAYNHEGGRVSASFERRGDGHLRLLVRDTGRGIAEQDLELIFLPFERLGTATSGGTGMGIGLALSKRIVEAMGGTMGIQSSVPGEGSVFFVELPLTKRPTCARADAFRAHVAMGLVEGPLTSATVMYVSEDPDNVDLVQRVLARAGIVQLTSVRQGRLAAELAAQRRPELILLDCDLPDVSGEDVLGRLRDDERSRDIPVVILSDDPSPQTIARLLDAGAADYVTQPLEVGAFLDAVRDGLALNRTP